MNKQTRSSLTVALMAALAIALVVQTIYLARLNNKLETLESSPTRSVSRVESLASASGPQQSWSDPPVYNDPFDKIRQMQNQADTLFGAFFDNGISFPIGMTGASISPNIEVSESENDYQIVIDVPENSELDLSTEIDDNTVRVAGSVSFSGGQNAGSIGPSFNSKSQFSRSIPLPHEIDPLAMQTDQAGNSIVITIPKA